MTRISMAAPKPITTTEADVADQTHFMVSRTDEEWRARLTNEQFHVCREKGTERPFAGTHWDNHAFGTFVCICCGAPLFSSLHKYDSQSGWPSFWAPIESNAVATKIDKSLFAERTEVVCSTCGSHLGHVFADGPPPTGQRYCVNSVAMVLVNDD